MSSREECERDADLGNKLNEILTAHCRLKNFLMLNLNFKNLTKESCDTEHATETSETRDKDQCIAIEEMLRIKSESCVSINDMKTSHPGDHVDKIIRFGCGHGNREVVRDSRKVGDIPRSGSEGSVC
jgi:hypothetical protein